MIVSDFLAEAQMLFGDTTEDTPKEFLVGALNWSFRELAKTPKLSKLFSRHLRRNLGANRHYRWDLNGAIKGEDGEEEKPFDRISDIEYLHFWSSTGGKPCLLNICWAEPREFYTYSLPEIAEVGRPCRYTLETEGDKTYLVLDRPSDVPLILDYIAYGTPREVHELTDEIPVPSLAKNALLDLMRVKYYQESDDLAQAGAFFDIYVNKDVPEMLQELYKRKKCEPNYIVGN